MNRRDFTKSLAALGFAPALPTLPTAATAQAAQVAYTPYMYGLGAHMARAKGQCSAAMLMQKLRLAPEAAQAMQAQLLRQGIITAPNAAGLATAAQSYMQGSQTVAAGLSSMSKTASDAAKAKLQTWAAPEDQNTPDQQETDKT